jgi:N-acetylglucosaminyl-diphospho-decaprenol L-rhamnosyltransferase
MTTVDVSIIVVSYNTADLLRACLRSTGVPGDSSEPTQEVIVVDNASDDHSAEMIAREFPSVRLVVNSENRGFAAAMNQAMDVAHGRHFLLLNSDAILRARAVQHLWTFLETHPRVALVGGQLFNRDGSFQSAYADFPTWLDEACLLTGLSRRVASRGYPSHPESRSQTTRSVGWVGGALLMARREAVLEVGRLDEAYFMYAEEMDWCLRMHQHGWEVAYLPDAQAVHWSGGSAHRQPERRRAQVYRSKWLYMRKHWGWPQAQGYRALVRVVSLMKLALWRGATLAPDPMRRSEAASQVASYRYLLAHF